MTRSTKVARPALGGSATQVARPALGYGFLGLLAIGAVSVFPTGCQSGGVGDPCVPEDEYSTLFAGFKVTEENIESRSFQCQTRICLVNHFQGRVSCPLGQPGIETDLNLPGRRACNGPGDDGLCPEGEKCVESGALAPECDPKTAESDCAGYGGVCNDEGKFCECSVGAVVPGFFCDAKDKHYKSYVCHKKGSCQVAGVMADANKGKDCCIPGSDTPVGAEVCGQCSDKSNRNADDAVYCSCRCLGAGETDDGTFNYCDCPTGFTCEEIRKYVGLGDKLLAGSYCIKDGTKFDTNDCNDKIEGHRGAACSGTK